MVKTKKLAIEEKEKLVEKYFKSKEELDKIRSDTTMMKWKVLSRAYKTGKKIWGTYFSVSKLAKDMEMPYTTVKRCLSLDKATPKSWKLVEEGKISAFKLAMICSLKCNGYQDEIVKEVIEKDLSTYQIKGFKPKQLKDVTQWKHRKAVEKGYARQETAYRAIRLWITRGETFMILPISSVGPNKKDEVLKRLKKLHDKIGRYLKKYG